MGRGGSHQQARASAPQTGRAANSRGIFRVMVASNCSSSEDLGRNRPQAATPDPGAVNSTLRQLGTQPFSVTEEGDMCVCGGRGACI